MNEIWNPWHGSHKKSAGRKHCHMFRGDELRGARHTTDDAHRASMFNLPVRKDIINHANRDIFRGWNEQ